MRMTKVSKLSAELFSMWLLSNRLTMPLCVRCLRLARFFFTMRYWGVWKPNTHHQHSQRARDINIRESGWKFCETNYSILIRQFFIALCKTNARHKNLFWSRRLGEMIQLGLEYISTSDHSGTQRLVSSCFKNCVSASRLRRFIQGSSTLNSSRVLKSFRKILFQTFSILTLSTLAVTVFNFALLSITFIDSLISTRKYKLNTNTNTTALRITRLCLFVKNIFTLLGQQIVNIFFAGSFRCRQFHFTLP